MSAHNELHLTIPDGWWMSANDRPHWRKKAAATANLRVLATAECQRQNVTRGLAKVRIVAHITYPRGGRVDPNNASPTTKALVDGMTDYGVTADDDHAHVIGPDHRYAGVTRGQHTVRLVIEEVE